MKLPQSPQLAATAPFPCRNRRDSYIHTQARLSLPSKAIALLLPAVLLAVAGCAGGGVTAAPSNGSFSIAPGTGSIDTNCTGCNTTNSKGASVEQFAARLPNGDAAAVTWSLSGGDPNSGPGSINASGQYTPPSYLTSDRADVVLTARLNSNGATATAVMTVTPGFLQPLTPENAALGANGQTTITGLLAEAGGANAISFALSSTASGASGGQGSLSPPSCQRTSQAFTSCTVTYTAPPVISATGVTYVVATVDGSSSKAAAALLLNSAGVASTPATHQALLLPMMQLGVSGGHNTDYDTHGKQIADCCGGTLGSLIQDSNGRQFLLSNNHVLARSDQASLGDTIVQPGLIDNNCTPYGDGPGTSPVGSLAGWLPLSSSSTNADAAIGQVTPGAVDPSGSILELGARQADGTLGAAPPGISSTGGRGETAALGLMVAKSGRTTGLTCASVSALDLDVNVDYYKDCAETRPYLTKTFTHQLAVSGNQFSDAGDSGSLLVDTSDAEPIGLFFAGGMDAAGISQGVANPATDVLGELSAQAGGATSYSFVGMADHAVSCLNYGDSTQAVAQARTLSDSEVTRAQQALGQARMLVNPSAGILGVGTGKSSDHPGEGAVIVYVDENTTPTVPATIDSLRTLVIPTNARAVALGSAPQAPAEFASGALPAAVLNAAVAVKQRVARNLMRQEPAFFGVGVGQSFDNPKDAALVIYVDRKKVPAQLAASIDGIRTRYVLMDRLHVTRSYAGPIQSGQHCAPHPATTHSAEGDQLNLSISHDLHLN
jgi:hypothetical protein